MAEIEVIADFPSPAIATSKKGGVASVGGLIGWKCPKCTSQNPLNVKSCKECQFVKTDESNGTTKGTEAYGGGLIGWNCPKCTFQNQLNVKMCKECQYEKTNEIFGQSMLKEVYGGGLIGWNCPKCTFQNPMSIKICKECKCVKGTNIEPDLTSSFPSNETDTKSSSQIGDMHRGFKSHVQELEPLNHHIKEVNEKVGGIREPPFMMKNDFKDHKRFPQKIGNDNGFYNQRHNNSSINKSQLQSTFAPVFETQSNQPHTQHMPRMGNKFYDQNHKPKPLMAIETMPINDGAGINNVGRNVNNLDGGLTSAFPTNGNNRKPPSQFGDMHRGFNSHVQDLQPSYQHKGTNHRVGDARGGGIRDIKPFQRAFGENQQTWKQDHGGFQAGPKQSNHIDKITMKLEEVFKGEATTEIPSMDMVEKKFNMRARLFIGNIGDGTTEENLKEMISQYGEVGETFFQKEKRFAFFRMATRSEAECAKRALDGYLHNGRNMKVRLSPHQGAIKVSNLSPWVSNELLYLAFSVFGDIERAFVSCDERGQSKEEGVVEFVNKHSAMESIRRCSDNCFFLTTTLRPVFVELMDGLEPDEDGLQDYMLQKRNQDYFFERSAIPRFAKLQSFEFEYGNKWKQLYEMKKSKLLALDREMKLEESKLIAQMEFSRYEHETESLRATLREKEVFCERQKQTWTMKQQQMDALIQKEKEKRKALNSSLARDIRGNPVPPNNPSEYNTELESYLKEKAFNPLAADANSKSEVNRINQNSFRANNIYSTAPPPNQQVFMPLKQENPQHIAPHPSSNIKPFNQNNMNVNKSNMYGGNMQHKIPSDMFNAPSNPPSFNNNSHTQYVGKFEKEINQMFPHLSNFNATFGNVDINANTKRGYDDAQLGGKHTEKKRDDPQLLNPEAEFGSINPLLQPPTED